MMSKFDTRWVATFSMLAFALSYAMRANYPPDASFGVLVLPLIIQGVAMSTFFLSFVTLSLNGVTPRQLPQATGLTNFARITGGSFAASLTTTFWERGAALHQNRLTEIVSQNGAPWTQAMGKLHSAGLTTAQSTGLLAQKVGDQAYLLSTLDFFKVSSLLALLLIPVVWLTRKPALSDGPPPAID
jgi:DHA2 family multidrug resistance protein